MDQQKKTSEKRGFKNIFRQRGARRGAVSLVLTILFIAAIVLVNIVMSAVTDRHPLYFDVTENASYQLKKDTVDFLKAVDQPVKLYVLSKETDFENKTTSGSNYKYYVQANKLLHKMESSCKNIELHYIDLVSDPTFQTNYPKVNWIDEHMILVESGEQYLAVDFDDLFTYDQEQYYYYGTYNITKQTVEQAVMTAILSVTSTEKITVTVIEGQSEQDMSAFTGVLENNAYNVETVTMPGGKISDESQFVILYAPDADIDEVTYETLTKWLKNDGEYGHHLVYMPHVAHDPKDFPLINDILEDYGMEIRFGYIQDEKYATSYVDPYQSRMDYGDNTAYTEDLRNPDIPVVMTYSMPVTITDDKIAEPLLLSSDTSVMAYEEDNAVKTTDPQAFNAAAIGTLGGGADTLKTSSVVVISSPFAVSSQFLASYNNTAYFVNLFNTLAEHKGIDVVIEGKDPSAKELGVTSLSAIAFPSILTRFIIPIAVLLIGLIIWLRRRHQ